MRNILIKNATLIDGTGTAAQSNINVRTHQSQIAEIGQNLSQQDDEIILDGTGKTLIPGLFDMHGHLYCRGAGTSRIQEDAYTYLYLAGGVTSIFCPGSMDTEHMLSLKSQIAEGTRKGPRIFTTGFYIEKNKPRTAWMKGMDTIPEALEMIDKWHDQVDAVKLYERVEKDMAEAVIKRAHSYGLPVTGHLGAITTAEAVDLGIDGLEHGLTTMSDIVPHGTDFLTSLKIMKDLDLDGPVLSKLLDKIAKAGTYVTPTIVIFASMDRINFVPPADWKKYLSPAAFEAFETGANDPISKMADDIVQTIPYVIEKQIGFVKRASERGIRTFAGTDPASPRVVPGYALGIELQYFIDAGLAVEKIINMASLESAKVFGRHQDLGSIEVGKQADMVVLDGDITKNFAFGKNTRHVIQMGLLHDPAELRKMAEGNIL